MRQRAVWSTTFAASLVAAFGWGLASGGCGAGGSETSNTGGSSPGATSSGTSTGGNGSGGEGGCLFGCDTTTGAGGSQPQGVLMVQPATASLVVDNGSIQTQQFTATLGGKDVTAQVQWVFERPDIGDVDANALFQPTGDVGGVGKLTAKINKSEGSAQVSVTIQKTVNTAGLSGPQQQQFDSPSGPDGSLNVVYPYPETVFPLGVLAPEVQWNGAANGDVYKLSFKEKFYEYTEYFTTSLPARHLIAEADWASVENSGSGSQSDPLTMSLQRMQGGTVYQPKTMTLHVAQGRLRGSVYYWELPNDAGNGRILRIKPDSASVDQFFTANGSCYGCHSVSRDGKKMMASFSEGLPFPQRTIDLSQNPAQYGSINGNQLGGTFSAWNDKGDKIVVSNDAASNPSGSVLRIVDATTGAVLNPNAMGTGCGEPSWSPDGMHMAGICGLGGGGWIFDATSGFLAVGDVAADGVTVSNVHSIVPQPGAQGRPAYPSYAPGSEWIAFGRPTQGSRSTGQGDLWIVNQDGTGLKKLATASNDNKSFNPVFAPLRAGGYFWLVFITRRDYGNQLVGANNQQLWVTAIDDPPSAADPSHPPFYMRGQEMTQKSENAYYALDPCKEIGQGCLSGVDCCNGQCVKDPNTSQYVCGDPPPPGQCSEDGNACQVDADCCNAPNVKCLDGFCQPPPPK
jgi:hypothetical protein